MTIYAARVQWTPTAYGPDFEAALLYRAGHLVAEVLSEDVNTFDDWEPLRVVEQTYTMRTRRADGSLSLPTPVETITVPAAHGLAFVSNVRPELNLEISAQFLDIALPVDRAERTRHGRDYSTVDRGAEDRGDVLSFDVNLLADELVGRAILDDLEAIIDADLPYIRIVDGYGNGWFADVDKTGGASLRRPHLGVLRLRAPELTDRPLPVTVTV